LYTDRKSVIVSNVNSWQRIQSRRRTQSRAGLLLSLIVGSGIITVIVYVSSPRTFEQLTDVIIGRKAIPIAEPVKPEPAPAPKKVPVRRRVTTATPAGSVTPAQPAAAQSIPALLVDPNRAALKSDAPVYSYNSPASSVVRVLKKGEQVETNLEVIDSGGRWTLVRKRELNKSGFVRSENLDHSPANAAEGGPAPPTGESGSFAPERDAGQ